MEEYDDEWEQEEEEEEEEQLSPKYQKGFDDGYANGYANGMEATAHSAKFHLTITDHDGSRATFRSGELTTAMGWVITWKGVEVNIRMVDVS